MLQQLKCLWVCVQVRIATRLGTKLISSDFNSREYYPNIRKAMTAGYFMQVRRIL